VTCDASHLFRAAKNESMDTIRGSKAERGRCDDDAADDDDDDGDDGGCRGAVEKVMRSEVSAGRVESGVLMGSARWAVGDG